MTAKLSFQIEIPKRSNACSQKQESFASGSTYFSVLTYAEDGSLKRQDFCTACWDGLKNSPDLQAKTHWKSRVVGKKSDVDRNQDRDERALELLKDALTRNTKEDNAEAFVLALYLARRRILSYRQQMQHEDGSMVNLYEVAATEEMLCVRSVALSQLQVASLQKSLAAKLSNGRAPV